MDNYPTPRIPVSELRTKDCEGDSDGDFIKVDLSGGVKEAILTNYVRKLFSHAMKGLKVDHLATLLATLHSDIVRSAYTLGFRAENESEICFMLGDSLIKSSYQREVKEYKQEVEEQKRESKKYKLEAEEARSKLAAVLQRVAT